MISKSLKNVGANSAGMKGKLKSFEDILLALKYGCSGKRTKTNERLVSDALKDFQIYYLSRNESQGGGIAIGVIKDLESTLIRE